MPIQRTSRRLAGNRSSETIADPPISMSRPRRSNGASEPSYSASVSRRPSTTDPDLPSMRLKVTLPPSKLREVTSGGTGGRSGGSGSGSGRPITQANHRSSGTSVSINSRDQFIGGEILEGKRARNVKKSYVLDSDSEDDEMEDAIEDDEDAEGEDEDMDAEGEDEDADGDIEMDMPPPPPTITISPTKAGKVTISAKPTGKGDGMSVERKEALDDSDDDELSELDSNLDDDEETMQFGNEDDIEGEDEDADGEEVEEEVEEEDEEEEDLDSDDDTPGGGSRGSTPDLTKLTKRQRARLEEGGSGHLLALPDGIYRYPFPLDKLTQTEVQVKKHLTAEEHAMRRAEMARRRKNLSEKRNEEEKVLSSPLHSNPPYNHNHINITRWKRSTSSSRNKLQRPMLVVRT